MQIFASLSVCHLTLSYGRFYKAFEAMPSPPKPVDRDHDQKTAHSDNCVVHVKDVHRVCRRQDEQNTDENSELYG
jgi:hypothetical protein